MHDITKLRFKKRVSSIGAFLEKINVLN